jgi:hypothetical protein
MRLLFEDSELREMESKALALGKQLKASAL